VLNTWPAPLTVGTMQFGVGCLYANLIWMLQLRGKRPQLFNSQPIHAVGFWHAAGQLTSMISLGAGPMSFTHIVKALEPFFSALVSVLVFGQVMHPVVYATLLPVVGGVGYACLKERSFSWLAFWMAMASNVAFALRAVLSKVAMSNSSSSSSSSIGTNLTPTNVFGLVTESAFWISIPIALVGEGLGIRQSWADATKIQNGVELLKAIFVSGFFHYINNEVRLLWS
jgi:solute carrier family 35, member E1